MVDRAPFANLSNDAFAFGPCATRARAWFRGPAQIWPARSSSFDLAAPERLAGLLNAASLRGSPEADVVSKIEEPNR